MPGVRIQPSKLFSSSAHRWHVHFNRRLWLLVVNYTLRASSHHKNALRICSGSVFAYSSHHTHFQCNFDTICYVPVQFCAEKKCSALYFIFCIVNWLHWCELEPLEYMENIMHAFLVQEKSAQNCIWCELALKVNVRCLYCIQIYLLRLRKGMKPNNNFLLI